MPLACEVVDDRGQHRVVEALAELRRRTARPAGRRSPERLQAVRHELVPESPVLGIAGVELGGLGLRGRLDGRVAGLDSILGQAIQPGQLGHGIGGVSGLVAGVLPAPEDHAELRAPVAQVVVADHLMAQGREDPGQAVADHGRADVPHVHRLGDVGRGEVDDDRPRLRGRHETGKTRHRADRPGCARSRRRASRTFRNPGPATSGGPASGSRSTASATSEARSRGLTFSDLGQRHAAVGLVIAELGVIRRADGGLRRRRHRRLPAVTAAESGS